MIKCKFICMLITSFLIVASPAMSQTVLLDNFNRANNNSVANGWNEVETVANTSIRVTANELRLGSSTIGRDYTYQDVSTLYNTVFDTNTGMLTWAFNMRQTRPDPSGFENNNYGVAFVLGCNTNNFLTGNGYAIVLGNSGTADNLRLVRFSNGIDANANMTNIISPVVDYGNSYLTVKVTYNPVGDNWSLYVGSNLGFFDNPATAAYSQLGATTGDGTYTSTDLLFMGCGWNHATSATDYSYFDNILIPNLCTIAPQPTTQSNSLTFSSIGANSTDLNWIRGNGTECIIIGRGGGSVSTAPVDGASYISNTSFGSGTQMAPGEFVVYSGSANTATITDLNPTTNYQFKIFEYNGTGCISNYLVTSPATAALTTIACVPAAEPGVGPSNPSILASSSNNIQLGWTSGNGSYAIVVVKNGSPVATPPVDGATYMASSIYGAGSTTAPGEYVVYSGSGSSVTVTGLLSSTNYHFAIYEVNGTGCNSNYLQAISTFIDETTSVSASYIHYYGTLHAHSDYSDGDMDNVCNGPGSAYCCYDIANSAMNFDFMGIADHNHNEGPAMTPAKYANGIAEANLYTSTYSDFVALFGMEWGTLSTGGHIAVFGIDQLVGWNTGNYDIFNAKGDYNSLLNLIESTPNAYATLCHPNNTDFGNIAGIAYNPTFDNAIVGVAVKNGPYNSTNTSYSDPSSGNSVSYYNKLLALGYRIGPTVDLDNHNSATMGKCSQGRTVVLATSLSKASINDAMLNMRFYASEDFNSNVSYTVNTNYPMGSIVTQSTNPVFNITVSDPDAEATTSIRIWYGVPGSSITPTILTSVSNANSLTYTHTFAIGSFYYYTEITQADGNKIWTSPIWYTKISSPLPIELLSFTGRNTSQGNLLEWVTATELNNDYFNLKRSRDGINFEDIAIIKGAGTSLSTNSYNYLDATAPAGLNYYQLKQTDFDGHFSFSNIIYIKTENNNSSIEIYPNPNDGSFAIYHSADMVPELISAFDVSGRMVSITTERTPSSITVKLPDVSEGIYTLRIVLNQEIIVKKIVVKK